MSESTYDDEYDEFDEEEGISGFVVLLVGALILVAFGSIVAIAYQKGMQDGGNQVPHVVADPKPIKTERELASVGTRNQEVFDRLEGNEPAKVVISAASDEDPLSGFNEVASASSKQPITKPATKAPVVPKPTAKPTAELTKPKEIRTAKKVPVPSVKPKPKVKPAPVQTASAVKPKPVAPVVPPKPNNSIAALSGSHLVQVGAFQSNKEAQAHFSQMQKKFGAMVSSKSSHVEKADLGAKGTFYRLRVGPFDSKGAAASYCAQLKDGGQDCLIKAL